MAAFATDPHLGHNSRRIPDDIACCGTDGNRLAGGNRLGHVRGATAWNRVGSGFHATRVTLQTAVRHRSIKPRMRLGVVLGRQIPTPFGRVPGDRRDRQPSLPFQNVGSAASPGPNRERDRLRLRIGCSRLVSLWKRRLRIPQLRSFLAQFLRPRRLHSLGFAMPQLAITQLDAVVPGDSPAELDGQFGEFRKIGGRIGFAANSLKRMRHWVALVPRVNLRLARLASCAADIALVARRRLRWARWNRGRDTFRTRPFRRRDCFLRSVRPRIRRATAVDHDQR